MSADNWTTCPKCEAAHKAAIEAARTATAEAYGRVPREEFDALDRKADALKDRALPLTLREDYEIGVRGTAFEVNYGGSCDECGFQFSHRFSKDLQSQI